MARHDLSVGDAPPFDHAFEKIIDEEFLAVLRRGHARPPPFGRHGPAGDDPPLLFEMQAAVAGGRQPALRQRANPEDAAFAAPGFHVEQGTDRPFVGEVVGEYPAPATGQRPPPPATTPARPTR